MSEPNKKQMRMAGNALRVAARLMETPGTGKALFKVASKQLGVDQLHSAQIPPETPMYRHLHLNGSEEDKGE